MTIEENAKKYANDKADKGNYDYAVGDNVYFCKSALEHAYIAGSKENIVQWHIQSDKDDIYDACNDWSVHYFICKMKDGSYNMAFGNCDEDCNGGVSTNVAFEFEDEKYYLDDILAWFEIPQFKE